MNFNRPKLKRSLTKNKQFFLLILFYFLNCIKTEKQACYHDIKLDGGPKSDLECYILPLYYDSVINEPGKTEKEKESLLYLKNSILRTCAEDTIKSEKCKNESNYKLTIRS